MGRRTAEAAQIPATAGWELITPAPGVLQVRLLRKTLAYQDVRKLAERLLSTRIDETLVEVVFDFGLVRSIESPWTPVVAQLIDFARRSHAFCRITSLHGQPAAVIGLLLSSAGCESVIRADSLSPACVN